MVDKPTLRGPAAVNIGDWRVNVATDFAPLIYDKYVSHAALVDEINLDGSGRYFLAAVSNGPSSWPELVVALRYQPDVGGFDPAVAVTGSCVFVGAGNTALCYVRQPNWRRLWTEELYLGFWGWALHADTVLLEGELTFAAWDVEGSPLWKTFVKPPWTYEVDNDRVALDIMGSLSTFDLRAGPGEPHS